METMPEVTLVPTRDCLTSMGKVMTMSCNQDIDDDVATDDDVKQLNLTKTMNKNNQNEADLKMKQTQKYHNQKLQTYHLHSNNIKGKDHLQLENIAIHMQEI